MTTTPPHTHASGVLSKYSDVLSVVIFAAAVGVLIGWWADIPALQGRLGNKVSMNPLTAVLFALCSVGVFSTNKAKASHKVAVVIASSCAILTFAMALLCLFRYTLNTGWRPDEVLFHSKLAGNRMAPNTAGLFVLTAIALLLSIPSKRSHASLKTTAQWLAGAIAVAGGACLVGHLFSAHALYQVANAIPMAVGTAVFFMLTGTALLFAHSPVILHQVLFADTLGSVTARRLLPAAVLAPFVLGWLRLQGQKAGLYSNEFGVALMASGSVAVVTILVFLSAIRLNVLDAQKAVAMAEREHAAQLLQAAHNELEQKVRERTAELAASNAKLQQEIVQRTDAEAEAQRQKQFLNAVLDSMQEAIVACNASGQMTLFNRASRELHGIGEESISPEKWAETDSLFEPDGITPLPREKVPLYRALQGESLRDAEMVISPPGGQKRFLLASGQPITSDGNAILGAVVAMRDVTELREAQESRRAHELADAANRAKSEFLSRMSHELRTPLNAILGFAQVLELDQLSTDQQDSVKHIIRGGRHLLTLINEVLDISRIEAGRLALSLEPVHLHDAIQDAVDFISPMAAQRKVSIHVGECADAQCYVLGDMQRIKQVLLNLLSNAVKYNREGGRVTLSFVPMPGNRFRVAVEDTGHGIAPESLPRLFLPFERLGAEQSMEEGTGLGLALSRKLIELMKGEIGVDSRRGEGSTFWFELPRTQAPIDKFENEMPPVVMAQNSNGPLAITILYIEDNVSNLRLVERVIVQRPAVDLVTAMTAQAGIELAKARRPDLIFLDLNLPDMNGAKVLDELLMDPITRDIPIIVISADATPGQLERLLRAGATDYLTKPIDVSHFLRIIDDAAGSTGASAGPVSEGVTGA